jgi:transposase
VGPYIASVQAHVPKADGKIVFDKFHVAKHLGEAVDKVRRKEQKMLKAAGDDWLAGTRYDWLRNPAKMEPKDRKELAEPRTSELKNGARLGVEGGRPWLYTATSTSGRRGNISAGGPYGAGCSR